MREEHEFITYTLELDDIAEDTTRKTCACCSQNTETCSSCASIHITRPTSMTISSRSPRKYPRA